MDRVGILTDSTVQFTRPNFPGRGLVRIIDFNLQEVPQDSHSSFPRPNGRLYPPTARNFLDQYNWLGQEFAGIAVITLSLSLNPAGSYAQQAKAQYAGRAHVQVIDSQTTSLGLGLLVQLAAGVAASGAGLAELERAVRAAVHNIYTLFCIPNLTYLAQGGYLSHSQAMVGEMLGLLPLFVLEEGILSPTAKAHTQRHLLESFQEFVEEFSHPSYIGLTKAAAANHFRPNSLRQYVKEHFPNVPFDQHVINPHLAALLGPQSTGLVVMEGDD
jgi:DegV family protein with EDD domain